MPIPVRCRYSELKIICLKPVLLYGKPDGRFYYTGKNRFGKGYVRVDKNPEHASAVKKLKEIADSLPDHLGPDHSFWKSKSGENWAKKNKELKNKQLYNHPDYQFYDEKD